MKKPIRVLHVFGQLNRGGAETMVMNIYRKIPREIIQFDFVTHVAEENAYKEEILNMGGRVFYMPYYKGYNHLEYTNAWRYFYSKNNDIKIVHSHFRTTAFIYLKLALKSGAITIAHSHSTSEELGLKGRIISYFQKRIRKLSDYKFACSSEAGHWLFGNNSVCNKDFFILKNAIDVEKYKFNEDTREKVRKALDIEKKVVIGHVGNFRYAKNHDFIIDMFNDYHKNHNKESVLLLFGQGELMSSIEKKATKYGISDAILFMGNVENVEEYLQALDIFVFPSIYEGLGMALIEAQAAGLPSLVSKNIPSEAIVCDSTIPLDLDIKLWCSEIKNLLNLYNRKNNQHEVVINAGYDTKTTSKYMTEFYQSIICDGIK